MATHITFLASIFAIFFLSPLSQFYCLEDEEYSICSHPYNCGNLTNISYPFYGENRLPSCGSDGFELECRSNQTTFIKVGENRFIVLDINPTAYTMRIRREELVYNDCEITNPFINAALFSYFSTVENLTIFTDCNSSYSIGRNNYTCPPQTADRFFYVNGTQLQQFSDLQSQCKHHFQVPVLRDIYLKPDGGLDALTSALEKGFDVRYLADWSKCLECMGSKGLCGSRLYNISQFSCHCGDGTSQDIWCPITSKSITSKNLSNWKRKIIIGASSAAISTVLVCIVICCCRCKLSILQQKYWNMKSNDKDIEAFIRNHGTLALRRYKFSDVKKMTNSFKVKLGQGGFGAVYKGKLVSGSLVAVKILNVSKGKGEEFINEVASISRTSHVNVVSLLGFCFKGRKKALIYEFMANGSLEKFIYKTNGGTFLSWEKLYQIAVGIARGLEYLHRGCSTRIFHFDIKPHNILLDENFCPKISDFGLAKLCLTRESIISMSDARGTLGYMAPEVWNRNFGGVSHKSDVYSYGMMLLEMVGGRKNINTEANQISEIYFPDWVHKKLELGLGLDGVTTSEENNIAKRMTLVGLWCIQTIPSHRPTMGKVIEMLEGSLDSLEMPPKPSLSSPTRSTPESSTT